MRDLGDRTEDSTIDFTFHTTNESAAPTTLAGTPAISVYKANGTTQSTAGITLTVDFDGVTGLNHVRIDTSADAFYAVANDYSVVITTGTVNSISVVGATVATFSIENRFDEVNTVQIEGSDATDQINAACDTALVDIGLDHLLSASVAGTDVTDNSVIAKLVSKSATADWDDFVNTTDALQAIRDKQTDVETDTQDIQSRLPAALVSGRIDASVGAMAADVLTAAAAAADFGTEIRDLITGGAYSLDTDANGRMRIVDGTGAGELDTTLGTVLLRAATEAQIDAIETDTNELQGDWTDGGRLDLILDAILVDTAEIGAAGAGLTAVPWNASWDAEVQSEVEDALAVARAEPGQGAPAATLDFRTKIDYLFKQWRNKKEQTSSTQSLYDDAGTTVDQKRTVSDDGTTATLEEVVTGP